MITREEYELLKQYRVKGYRWIARDEDEELYLYETEPTKLSSCWLSFNIDDGIDDLCDGDVLFQSIKWEDEKPTKIDDLIRDYESHQVIVGERVKVQIPQFIADWIEEVKGTYTLKLLFANSDIPSSVEDWLYCNNGNCEKMALAWIYGYEVEKEKLYTVDLNFNQALGKRNGVIKFYDPNEQFWIVERKLTKAEIESVNPILMQIAEEVE